MTESYYFCPKCGVEKLSSVDSHRFDCASCGFQIYHNVATTVSLVVSCDRKIMFAKRGREPSKGLLDFPGGFVDPGESLEQALFREMREELDWTPNNPQYLFSCANTYPYAGVLYNTADAMFVCELEERPAVKVGDDVDALVWSTISELDRGLLAFGSMHEAISMLERLGY